MQKSGNEVSANIAVTMLRDLEAVSASVRVKMESEAGTTVRRVGLGSLTDNGVLRSLITDCKPNRSNLAGIAKG